MGAWDRQEGKRKDLKAAPAILGQRACIICLGVRSV